MSAVAVTVSEGQSFADIARGIIARAQGLKQRFLEALDKLKPKEKWELMKEVARAIALTKEKVDFAAHVQKEVVDKWSDAEKVEMGINQQDVETELQYTTVLVPCAEAHMVTERRKAETRRRLVAAWGDNWEENMGNMMPSWPAAEFLRHLAVYAETHSWESSAPIFEARIKERLAAPRTKKNRYLMIRDFVESISAAGKNKGKGKALDAGPTPRIIEVPQEQGEEVPAGQEAPVEDAERTGPIGDDNTQFEAQPKPTAPTENAGSQGPSRSSNTLDSTGHSGKELVGSEAGSTAVGNEATVDDTTAPLEEEEAPRLKKKTAKRKASEPAPEQLEVKQRRFGIEIPVINLDVEEGIKEIKDRATDEEEKDNALAAEAAVRGLLFGQERIHGTLMLARLQLVMEALKANIIEIEDD